MPHLGGFPAPEQFVRRAVNARQLEAAGNITDATNATPIVVTLAGHGYLNGELVLIESVGGNTAANGWRLVANKTVNTFELTTLDGTNVAGNGAYTAGGTAKRLATAATIADAVFSSRDVWITSVRLVNTTGAAITFTLTDNLSGATATVGPLSKYAAVSIAANTVSREQADDSPPTLCDLGAVFYSSATGLHIEIQGWRKPNFS